MIRNCAGDSGSEIPDGQRFSAKGLASHRKQLGLSAAEVGILLGTSAQSIDNWEQGKSRPRASHLPAIAAFIALGERTAMAVISDRAPKGKSHGSHKEERA